MLLIVGSPHLANNNRDLVNARIEDVTTADRQRDIERLVEDLARFRPTRIALEWDAADQAGLDRRYADYRSGRLLLTANERDQIGLRLAAKLNLPRVDAVDWNDGAPGPQEAYDFPSWAARNGQKARLEELRVEEQAKTDAQTARWRCLPISDWYRELNTPGARAIVPPGLLRHCQGRERARKPRSGLGRSMVCPQPAHLQPADGARRGAGSSARSVWLGPCLSFESVRP